MTKRAFDPVNVLDNDDEQKIRNLATLKGVPDHNQAVKAVTSPPAQPTDPEVPLSTTVPKYVSAALKLNAAQGEGSIRYQLLKGLKAAGLVDVNDGDLEKDRRGQKPKG